jgi:type III pantothenate kinase
MLLAIDIGNTLTKFGVFDDEKLLKQFTIATIRENSPQSLEQQISENLSFSIKSAIISSVVPELRDSYETFIKKICEIPPIFVDSNFGLEIIYKTPETLGIDRAVAAFAAREKYGKPCIICDFGTATTIDVIDSEGRFIGGIIVAGIGLLADSLSSRTSKLPKIEIKRPTKIIGNSTISAIQSGTYFGYISLVEGIIERLFEEIGGKCQVIATGGFAKLISDGTDKINVLDENLMLEGLKMINQNLLKSRNI